MKGTATITSLGCESGLSSQLTVGREYTMYCTITNKETVVWTITSNTHNSISLEVGKGASSIASGFAGRFVKSNRTSITASLTFTASASLNQRVIACQDDFGSSFMVKDECQLQTGNCKYKYSSCIILYLAIFQLDLLQLYLPHQLELDLLQLYLPHQLELDLLQRLQFQLDLDLFRLYLPYLQFGLQVIQFHKQCH